MLYSIKNEGKKYHTKEDVEYITLNLKKDIDLIKELDFTSNVFKPEAMKEICNYISKMKNLKNIILDEIFTTLSKEDMLDCFRQISKALVGKDLILLDLSNNALSAELPDEFLKLLSNLNSLKFLKIRNCGIGQKGGDLIGECLSKLKIKTNLEYLDIAQNRFFVFPEKLIEGIKSLENLSVLKLEYNTIEKVTMNKALKVIKNQPLEILDIRDNFLNIEGCQILGEIFATWNIRELLMGDCLAHNEGILEFMRHANKKFVSMGLPGDYKEEHDVLLDISYNDWEQDCIGELSRFCKKYNIKKLNITGNFYEDESQLYKVIRSYNGQLICKEDEEEEEIKEKNEESLVSMIGKSLEPKSLQDTSDESFGSDLNKIKTSCEDIFNIDKDSTNTEYKMKIPLYNPHLAVSYPDLLFNRRPGFYPPNHFPHTQHVRIKKSAFDYLKEIAEKESKKLKKNIYEKNSFSSDNLNLKILKGLKNKKTDDDKKIRLKKKFKEGKRHKNKVAHKNVIIIDNLSNEDETIESFADFSDDLFTSKIRDDVKLFCCASPGCDVELPSLSRIKRHYLIHTNLKPFKCVKCEKKFSRKDNMLQHYRTHCKNKKHSIR